MGRAIESAAITAGHAVVAKIDPNSPDASATEISAENLNGAELAIEFTHPDVVVANLRKLAELKIPTVVGTTGWSAELPEVEKMAAENSVGILHAGNFSVGVNVFYSIVERAAQLLTDKNFDVAVREIHHSQKADAPSGTAREIATRILANFPEKKEIISDNSELPIPPEKLQISAARIGKVVGVHEVVFDGASDSIQLIHSGKNRDGYAAGAVAAGEWLVKKDAAGVFTATDWLGF